MTTLGLVAVGVLAFILIVLIVALIARLARYEE